jgi:hypothetical protein
MSEGQWTDLVRSEPAVDLSAASRRFATLSRSSSNRSAYTSSVIDAFACPSIRCTAFTLAPALIARLAAVWRKSCGVIAGNDLSAGLARLDCGREEPLTVIGDRRSAVRRPRIGSIGFRGAGVTVAPSEP